ncbi:MAG: elongation factor Ts [Gammaproteobacteria bacterium]|nr:elongation factor Ts [Gammaproteobacteria bacterium]
MAISASMVKELRDRTGLGMMECKKALKEAGGDIEKAIEDLRKASGLKAAKKAGRTAAEGLVAVSANTVVEVNSETDFVARDESFKAFVVDVADAAAAQGNDDVQQLLDAGFEAKREALVQKIGENISIRRFATLSAPVVGSYVHSNGRIAVLVGLEGGSEELARDVAMHIAAVNPRVAKPEDMPEDVVESEKNIIKAQPDMEGKPAEIVEKMMVGRIRKFLAENSLVEQQFVKNPDQKVGQLLKEAGADIQAFVRFEVGEGIEKEETDFAAEVAAQVQASK